MCPAVTIIVGATSWGMRTLQSVLKVTLAAQGRLTLYIHPVDVKLDLPWQVSLFLW